MWWGAMGWGGVGLVKVCIFHNQKMHFYLIFWLSLWPAINLGNAKNQTRIRSINATFVLRHPFVNFVLYLECVSKRRLSHFLNSKPLSSQGGLWGLRKNKRPNWWRCDDSQKKEGRGNEEKWDRFKIMKEKLVQPNDQKGSYWLDEKISFPL